jgi:hypothetical protein
MSTTRSICFLVAQSRVVGTDDPAERLEIIERWGEQIAESKFDGVTFCERGDDRWALITRSEWDKDHSAFVPRTTRHARA